MEDAVRRLGALGIEADIILFHPYDRWGFADMGPTADDRYLSYVVRRLWAFPNVWWSMANEYDFVASKTESDWERLAQVVVGNDPCGHLCSIHNGVVPYDHSKEWITHVSVQGAAERIEEWRRTWKKPVVLDECGYEGNIEYGWGNITGQELTRRFWEGAVRGGYVGHGETYHRDDERLWWAKGGELTGDSPERIAFLRRVVEEGSGVLEPTGLGIDGLAAKGADGSDLLYFGIARPLFSTLSLSEGRYRVDVIDTWNMTIDSREEVCREGTLRVALPGREYIALRVTAH
ncbi:DUF5605 domain-containing protein [Actinomadura sp. CNU-125]|uniref:DUF5605 domain-containing protein n=1 Tax=Actinomadura sp. CNU-125 TaxID=1904961 RepID=UPI0021CCEA5A|nr:DUF5605 domain-containing protein [Actinomadura sp. CNU-125]